MSNPWGSVTLAGVKKTDMQRFLISLCAILLAACTPSVAVVMPAESHEPTGTPNVPTATLPPSSTATVLPPSPTPLTLPDEAIAIRQPGPGSVATSPLNVEGIADPAFEQTIILRLVSENGTVLAEQPAIIKALAGGRGAFEGQLYFIVWSEGNAFLQAYHESPRDGALVHLASVALRLSPTGPSDLKTSDVQPERITILAPEVGAQIGGAQVKVEGIGIASFEQTLLVEVYDGSGSRVGGQPVILQGVGLGERGPFSVTVPYEVTEAGPGRIVVRDISPAFGGDVHLASVEVELSP